MFKIFIEGIGFGVNVCPTFRMRDIFVLVRSYEHTVSDIVLLQRKLPACHGHWFWIEKLLVVAVVGQARFLFSFFFFFCWCCSFSFNRYGTRLKFNSKTLQCCWMFRNFMHRMRDPFTEVILNDRKSMVRMVKNISETSIYRKKRESYNLLSFKGISFRSSYTTASFLFFFTHYVSYAIQ